jgi:hypothetical protein
MLWEPLKVGVLNPAGASAGGCAAAPANAAPTAANVAARQEWTRILFERGMSMTP